MFQEKEKMNVNFSSTVKTVCLIDEKLFEGIQNIHNKLQPSKLRTENKLQIESVNVS